MHRLLVVANRTLGSQELRAHIAAALGRGPCEIRVVAPSPDEEHDAAQQRLASAVASLSALGARVEGTVTGPDPVAAVEDALGEESADEIVVSTRPAGISRWLGRDLPAQLRDVTGLPFTHLIVPSGRSDRLPAAAVRLSVFLGESDTHRGSSVAKQLVRRARELGLAGATLLRGVEGFGASNVVHRAGLLSLSDDLPLILIVVDAPDRIESFLTDVEDLVAGGLVLRERVEVLKYEGDEAPPPDRAGPESPGPE